MLTLFFPDISLWKIIQEEILRTRYLNNLHSLGFTSATEQQLMSIQQGKLFVTTPGAAIDYKLLERSYGNKEIAAVATRDGTALDELQAAVRWCSETPKGDCIQLNIANVRSHQHFLASLPTGKQTWKGIGYPDIGTPLLALQLVWLLITIALRLANGYKVSLLELYCLFSLVAFVAERIVYPAQCPGLESAGCGTHRIICLRADRFDGQGTSAQHLERISRSPLHTSVSRVASVHVRVCYKIGAK